MRLLKTYQEVDDYIQMHVTAFLLFVNSVTCKRCAEAEHIIDTAHLDHLIIGVDLHELSMLVDKYCIYSVPMLLYFHNGKPYSTHIKTLTIPNIKRFVDENLI